MAPHIHTNDEQGQMTDDPLAEARARGQRFKPLIIARAGGLWTTGQVAAHLGMDEGEVEAMAREGSLLRIDDGEYQGYPACQFAEAGIIPGLPEVLRAIDSPSGWTRIGVLFSQTLWSGNTTDETVLEAVRRGNMFEALHAARNWDQPGK